MRWNIRKYKKESKDNKRASAISNTIKKTTKNSEQDLGSIKNPDQERTRKSREIKKNIKDLILEVWIKGIKSIEINLDLNHNS